MKKVHVKKGDTVCLLVGDPADKYTNVEKKTIKTGTVLEVSPKEGKVIVEGVNVVHKHVKPRKQGDQGGIIETEGAVYACKVALYCDKCGAGRRAKTIVKDGKKVRVCCKCGKEF